MASGNLNDMDWRDQLGMFQKDRNLGQTELSRALNQSNLYKASGDTDNYNKAQTWIGQVNTAMGNPTDRQGMQNTTQQNYYNNVNNTPFQFKAPAAFNYDQNTDPQYQSALKGALRNAQTAQSNAMVGLGSRGIANSSVAVDRSNQIQQRAVGDVQTNILPQLIQQAFQRYQDSANRDYQTQVANYGAGQDQIKNQGALAGYFNNLDQVDVGNQRNATADAARDKQANWGAYLDSVNLTGNLGDGPKADWSLLNGVGGSPSFEGQKYIDTKDRQGRLDALDETQQKATIANMNSDNARAAAADARAKGNDELAQLFDVWDRTGQAPEGIPGVAAGTPLGNKSTSNSSSESAPADRAYNDFQTNDLNRLDSADEGYELINMYRDSGVDEKTLSKMIDAVNKRFAQK